MNKRENTSVTSDQAFYDDEPLGSLCAHEKWMREIEYYFLAYAERLESHLAESNGRVAELGAGSCGLSVCMSRLRNVKYIASLDISAKRMARMIDHSASVLGGDITKIKPLACDFNRTLPFADGELDAILFDAALHHARSMWNTLAECNRALKTGGLLIAQRESYLSPLRAKWQLAQLKRSPEVSLKVSENMYLKHQYEYYAQVSGFQVEFIFRSKSKLKNILRSMSGILFTDGVLLCKKV